MKIDHKTSFTQPRNLVACVQGAPTHLNICLIRKVKLRLLLPAITPPSAKPNINAFCVTHRFTLFTSHVHPSGSADNAELTKWFLVSLSSALSPRLGSAPIKQMAQNYFEGMGVR